MFLLSSLMFSSNYETLKLPERIFQAIALSSQKCDITHSLLNV